MATKSPLGFPAVQEPRDAARSLQGQVINIRERLRLIEAQLNLQIDSASSSRSGLGEAPADGNIYGRRDFAWTIVRLSGVRFTYSQEAPDLVESNPGDEWFESDSGILYTLVDDGEGRQWVELAGQGEGAAAVGPVVVDIYSTPGTYTWTKDARAYFVEVVLIGGGGGGGAGGHFAPAGLYFYGGAGGGGGAYAQFAGLADSFGATETVVVGAAGAAGIGYTGSFPSFYGNPGGDGGDSSFAGMTAYGGGGGSGGSNGSNNGGGGGGAAGPGQNGALGGGSPGDFGGGIGGGALGTTSAGDTESYIGGGGGGRSFGGDNGGRAMGGAQGGAAGGAAAPLGSPSRGGNAYEWGKWGAATVIGGQTQGPGAPIAADPGTSAPGNAKSLRGAGGSGGCGNAAVSNSRGGDGGAGQWPGGGGGGGGGATLSVGGWGAAGAAGGVVVIQFRTN